MLKLLVTNLKSGALQLYVQTIKLSRNTEVSLYDSTYTKHNLQKQRVATQ